VNGTELPPELPRSGRTLGWREHGRVDRRTRGRLWVLIRRDLPEADLGPAMPNSTSFRVARDPAEGGHFGAMATIGLYRGLRDAGSGAAWAKFPTTPFFAHYESASLNYHFGFNKMRTTTLSRFQFASAARIRLEGCLARQPSVGTCVWYRKKPAGSVVAPRPIYLPQAPRLLVDQNERVYVRRLV